MSRLDDTAGGRLTEDEKHNAWHMFPADDFTHHWYREDTVERILAKRMMPLEVIRAWCDSSADAGYPDAVVSLARIRDLLDDHPSCCTACNGTGGTYAGPCWDCQGTGHAHPPVQDNSSTCIYEIRWTDEVGDIPVCVVHGNNSRHVDSDDPHRPCLTVDPYPGDTRGRPDRWWRVIEPDGDLRCETSDEQEARVSMRPSDKLQRLWTMEKSEWRDA